MGLESTSAITADPSLISFNVFSTKTAAFLSPARPFELEATTLTEADRLLWAPEKEPQEPDIPVLFYAHRRKKKLKRIQNLTQKINRIWRKKKKKIVIFQLKGLKNERPEKESSSSALNSITPNKHRLESRKDLRILWVSMWKSRTWKKQKIM